MSVHILDPGLLTLVEDLGRPGYGSVGVSRSGTLDRGALRMANRLVGNDEHAAGFEQLAGRARFRFASDTWFAVAGAWGAISLIGGSADGPVPMAAATFAAAGSELRIGPPTIGLRYVLAVRGGIDVPATLGSRSADTLSGLGPPALLSGQDVPIGGEIAGPVPSIEYVAVPPDVLEPVEIRAYPGPRADRFGDRALRSLFAGHFRVSAVSDRVGMRLDAGDGALPLERSSGDDVPSEAMVPGAVQVPPSGLPVILLADHPATGGYPVIATVADASLDRLAQLSGGTELLFRHAPPLGYSATRRLS